MQMCFSIRLWFTAGWDAAFWNPYDDDLFGFFISLLLSNLRNLQSLTLRDPGETSIKCSKRVTQRPTDWWGEDHRLLSRVFRLWTPVWCWSGVWLQLHSSTDWGGRVDAWKNKKNTRWNLYTWTANMFPGLCSLILLMFDYKSVNFKYLWF